MSIRVNQGMTRQKMNFFSILTFKVETVQQGCDGFEREDFYMPLGVQYHYP
jgi:hypothetical protein